MFGAKDFTELYAEELDNVIRTELYRTYNVVCSDSFKRMLEDFAYTCAKNAKYEYSHGHKKIIISNMDIYIKIITNTFNKSIIKAIQKGIFSQINATIKATAKILGEEDSTLLIDRMHTIDDIIKSKCTINSNEFDNIVPKR